MLHGGKNGWLGVPCPVGQSRRAEPEYVDFAHKFHLGFKLLNDFLKNYIFKFKYSLG